MRTMIVTGMSLAALTTPALAAPKHPRTSAHKHVIDPRWSAFGSFAFTPAIAILGRYDWLGPSKDLNPLFKDRYLNAGVDYKPIGPLDLALVYKRERANHGLLSTTNGTIGRPNYGTYDEFGLFGQFAF